MAMFEYEALTSDGRAMTGAIEADSVDDARGLLEKMHLGVTEIRKQKPRMPKGLARREFLLFNQQLAAITETGLPLEKALKELARDMRSPKMRKMVTTIADDLSAGVPIEEAFGRHASQFPPMYGRILAAGVQSGRLAEMLISLTHHMGVMNRTRRILLEATAYPAVVLLLAGAMLTAMLRMVVPNLVEMLISGWGVTPSVLTGGVVWLSNHIYQIWAVLGGVIVGGMVIAHLMRQAAGGRAILERLLMSVPVIGRVYYDSKLSRLTDSLALLIGAGCDMPTCLNLAGDAAGSENLRRDCRTIAAGIWEGRSITDAAVECRTVPGLIPYSMEVASRRNDLQASLYDLSAMYGRHASSAQADVQAFLTPLLLILVGFIVAACVGALFMPVVRGISMMGA